ncbi:phage holin family protein [Arcanobacterium phocisimile]|uniref:Phage holin family protein n=1 Tax=Arcanobacterium phocisimile TaxID=1302235 RepID=A0ABX7IHI3_9ACTO|nr:phage holin family protein [Arcanobacterium phocisimile]QRV02305.1 phage holin family protein [Arcanobacterium phocisimile]
MKFVIRILSNALALWVTTLLFSGFALREPVIDSLATLDPQVRTIIALLVGGLILSLVNAFVRPIVKLLSLPIYILTLGLFFVVVNAAMLMLTSWISGQVGVGIAVDSFVWAIAGGIVISVVNTALEILIPNKRK